jgi:hypothetical protein
MHEVIDDNFMGILAIVLVCMLLWDDFPTGRRWPPV